MKHIKTFKLFETNYNKEEFIDSVCRELSKYQIKPLEVKNIISKYEYEIQTKSENGESPQMWTRQLIKDLELDDENRYMSVNFNQSNNKSEIKYL